MLMKKSQYKSVMFTLSICLSSILLAILVAYACNLAELEEAKNEAYTAYQNAEQSFSGHNAMKPAIVTAGLVGSSTVVGGRMLIGGILTSVTASRGRVYLLPRWRYPRRWTIMVCRSQERRP